MSDDWPTAGILLATRYRLVERLESGGMADVWRADDELLGRPVAVKLPSGAHVAWREARMAARLSHPSIAAVHDYREAVRPDGTVAPFVVMELLAGETVAARLMRDPLSVGEAARIGAAVAEALAAAHTGGVVHRDIKPGNVMLTPTGVKILDFGISATAGEEDEDDTGATFGTPAYVAPERLDGMPAVPATDVYGLGVLLFEMVTGEPPYPVDTWEELAEARAAGPGTLPASLPPDFRTLVRRCLADDPAARPPAEEVRFDLTALWLADRTGRVSAFSSSSSSSMSSSSSSSSSRAGETMIWDGPAATDGGEIAGGSDAAFEGTSGHGPAPGGDGESGDQGPTAAENGETGHAHAGNRESGHGTAATKDRDNKPQPAAPQDRKNRHGPTATQDRENKPQPTASQDRDNRHGPTATRDRENGQGSAATRDREGGQGPDVGAPAAYRPGRAAASTIPMAAPQTRRFAVTVFLVALAVAGVVALVTWPHKTTVDARPSPTGTAATVGVPPEPLVTPSAPASTPPAPAVSPTPKLIFADAVSRMRSAVEDGAADGEIRADVATDLLNLIRPLSAAEGEDVNTQVDQLRRKISERLGEGSLAPGQADLLRSRLADLDRAAGT